MNELKPCPFCGRIPTVDDCGNNRFFVRCKCGIVQDKLYGQRCDAVRRWNTRHQQDVPDINVGDTIYRQAAIDAMMALQAEDDEAYGCRIPEGFDGERAKEVLEQLPSAQPVIRGVIDESGRIEFIEQPERKEGKWIDYSDDGYVECPFCGSATNCDDNINELHYCFSCGAKMEAEG